MSETELLFLKLGGSLITDKDQPHTSNLPVIQRLAKEIAAFRSAHPSTSLVIGHGSGSFGHIAAQKYHTRDGVRTPAEWRGFAEVWSEARALHEIITHALLTAGLPCIAFQPSASILTDQRKITHWNLAPLQSALHANLIPIVYGDVVFDTALGGSILSTEELFFHLAEQLTPTRILLAGLERGVWQDFPTCTRLLTEITPAQLPSLGAQVGGSVSPDVTGGMRQKVEMMLALSQRISPFSAQIFSAIPPKALLRALNGEKIGTLLHNPE